MKWIGPQPTGLFTVQAYKRVDGHEYAVEIAHGMTREKAAALAGILLCSPDFNRIDLQEAMVDGRWEEECTPETASASG